MTAVLCLVSLTAGLALGAGGAGVVFKRWAEDHHYRQVRLEATRVHDLYTTADRSPVPDYGRWAPKHRRTA